MKALLPSVQTSPFSEHPHSALRETNARYTSYVPKTPGADSKREDSLLSFQGTYIGILALARKLYDLIFLVRGMF